MAIVCKNLIKSFGEPPNEVIKGIDLEIKNGEFISISGRSGSGKSTLLYLLSTLDAPTSGIITIDDQEPDKLSVEDLHKFRNQHLGFVFQFHYLLPELTALENTLLPARKNGNQDEISVFVNELFESFDINNTKNKFPSQLSGGEQQRVAIIRALSMKPRYLFADEPTGNLDSVNGKIVMDILRKANSDWGMTLILVTHEEEYAEMAETEIFLKDGLVI